MSLLTTNYLAPTGREEAWRFTPIAQLGALLGAEAEIVESPSLSPAIALPAGVTLSTQSDVAPLSVTQDLVAIRVREIVSNTQVLEIAAHAELADPIFLQRANSGAQAIASRLLVKVGVNAHATLIIENSGEAVLAEEIEFDLATGAHLTFVTLQEWGQSSIHLAKHHAIVGKDALFTSTVVTIGGRIVRILPTVEYSGQGSSADLAGVYFATDGQHQEHRIHIDHNLPNAKSRVNYKGALAGDKAHSVWIGDVFIRANAEGTDTYELNRNLLLTDGARADSVPNLEIETGEIVGAGHASTTGRFDDEQLFYLESRGIPADQARRLVIRGFFAEIVNRIEIDAIEERIMDRIDSELAKVGE
jgi:Fe-S cluster assembly protein SufD